MDYHKVRATTKWLEWLSSKTGINFNDPIFVCVSRNHKFLNWPRNNKWRVSIKSG